MWHGVYKLVDVCKRQTVPFLLYSSPEGHRVPNQPPSLDSLFNDPPTALYRV